MKIALLSIAIIQVLFTALFWYNTFRDSKLWAKDGTPLWKFYYFRDYWNGIIGPLVGLLYIIYYFFGW